MNNQLINQLIKIKNIEYIGVTYSEDLNRDLPAFELKEHSVEEWNKKAKVQNTRMFIKKFNRQPRDYNEVLAWIYSMIPGNEESQLAGNELTFA